MSFDTAATAASRGSPRSQGSRVTVRSARLPDVPGSPADGAPTPDLALGALFAAPPKLARMSTVSRGLALAAETTRRARRALKHKLKRIATESAVGSNAAAEPAKPRAIQVRPRVDQAVDLATHADAPIDRVLHPPKRERSSFKQRALRVLPKRLTHRERQLTITY